MSVKKALRTIGIAVAAALVSTLAVSTAASADTRATALPAAPLSVDASASNLDFERGLATWEVTGAVTSPSGGAQHGGRYAALPANATATVTITGLTQGSYSLAGWFKGAASNNAANVTIAGTGGPSSVMLLDANLAASAWQQTSHRNVLVYSGEVTLKITAGSTALSADNITLTLDSADQSVPNWGFESGATGWDLTGAASVVATGADTGTNAVRLGAGAQVAQEVAVEPNTRYGFTVRARVDVQDTFSTEKVRDAKDRIIGERVHRESTGDRVNIGVKTVDGTVLRQAPAGTEGYSLASLTFETGPDVHSVVLYANTVKDAAYDASVTLWNSDGTFIEDPWIGNGDHFAHVDTVDLFEIRDDEYLRGADVSFLPAIEDKGGKYFANGVQQDALRILSNHGVNSILSMIFVQAGNTVYDNNTLDPILTEELDAAGNPIEYRMIEGYFDKVHTTALAARATELGMSYMPSFHYSDAWISAGKAYAPASWINVDYAGKRTNTDLAHIKSIVYNYVYDFISGLVAAGVDIAGVKQGNEQDGGLIWPIGRGATSVGHASIITATWDAVEAAAPGTARSVHSNNGYDTAYTDNIYNGLIANGAKFDGESHSLYGGRSSGNIIKMATVQNAHPERRYNDYLNVETGFAFTKYLASWTQQTASMGQSAYYRSTPNGQYNWLLDYQQAALDVPNPYGQTRGFYYWETDWIPTPGAGSSQTGNATVAGRIMFNNGDVTIKEMGSTRVGKAGDMMDSMYAYLWRGLPKAKPTTAYTALNSDNGIVGGAYAVTPTAPTGISIAQASVSLTTGRSERLKPTVTPTDQVLTDSTIRYSSSDAGVATVTSNGYIRAVAPGTATVTAQDAAGHSDTVAVTVNAPTTATSSGLTITAGGAPVAGGGTVTAAVLSRLDLTATLANTTERSVVFTSSNPAVASFFGETWQTPVGTMRQRTDDSSKVQLNIKRAGSTTITVTSRDGGATESFVVNATKVGVASVTLNKTSATVSNSRKLQLTATVAPANATLYRVNWTSSDTGVATVDSAGLVTAVGIGTASIRAESDDDPATAAVATITVVPVQVEGVVLNKSSLTVQTGSTKPLAALALPEDADNKAVTWSSSDASIATVNATGQVTGVQPGTATITATTVQGSFTAAATVTVQTDEVAVTGITLDHDEHYFASDYFSSVNPASVPPILAVTASIAPVEATKDSVTWTSDTPSVATVNSFGIITAVAAGVATITASTEGGEYSDSITVHVPSYSDSFDNRAIGDTWNTGRAVNYSGIMNSSVVDDSGDQVLSARGSGSGGRGGARYFTPVLKNDLVVFDFDWNVGQPTGTKGAFLTINDSAENRYLALQTGWATELGFASGGKSSTATTNEPITGTTPVGTGFNVNNVWYKIHVELDMKKKETLLTVTRKDNPAITATHVVPFAAESTFTGNVASLQWWTTRAQGATMSWTSMIDDVNVYKAAPVAKSVTVNSTGIRFIPITGTLMTRFQLESAVAPSTIDQAVTYTSANTNLVTVSGEGLVAPAHLYSSLNDVVSGTTTVRVASKADPTIYVDVPITVTNEIRASEFFWVEDASGAKVYEEGESGGVLPLAVGQEDTLSVHLTGGDGETDVAKVAWSSDDSDIVEIDPASGELQALANGVATITSTVTLYAGEPKVATIRFRVGPEPTVSSLTVTRQPTTTEYEVGDAFDATGLEVTATWSDGTTSVLTSDRYTLGEFSSAVPGSVDVTVALIADPSRTTSFSVTIRQPVSIAALSIAHAPTKTTYVVGESFAADGLEVAATWTDGTTSVVQPDAYELSGFSSAQAGTVQVTVSLKSDTTKKVSFPVTITTPVTIAVFSNTALTNAFTQERGDQVIRGDLECNSQVRVAGTVTVTGNAHLTNTCRIDGNLVVGGTATLDSTPVVSGSLTAGGDIHFQSTARVGGNLIAGGLVKVTDGASRADLKSRGRVGGDIRDGQQVTPLAVAPYAAPALPTPTKTWVQWLNAAAAAANAPTWMSGRSAAPGCTLSVYSVNTTSVAVAGAAVIDARKSATGSNCTTVSLQGMTVAVSGDLTILADGLSTINGARFTSADGQPHRVRILVPGVPGANAGNVSLSSSTTADANITVDLVAPGRVTLQNGDDFRGSIYAGGLATSGTVRIK